MNSPWSRRVADTMASLGQEFAQDELAYLALTSKVENPIRDRLAYLLHQKYGEEGNIFVAREWTEPKKITGVGIERVDIAIIDEEKRPLLLLEITAMYNSYNLFKRNQQGFPDKVRKDVEKLKRYPSKYKLEKIAMILVPNHTNSCPRDLEGVIKYRLWNHTIRCKGELRKAIKSNFKFKHFDSGCVVGGRAFGIGVDVHYWLFGPYR